MMLEARCFAVPFLSPSFCWARPSLRAAPLRLNKLHPPVVVLPRPRVAPLQAVAVVAVVAAVLHPMVAVVLLLLVATPVAATLVAATRLAVRS